MSTDVKAYKILDAIAPRAITSSTNASPIEVTTAAAHGLSDGDKVSVIGHAVNTNANGSFEIVVTGASTFELVGSVGNGVGVGTGVFAKQSSIALTADYKHVVLAFDTDGGGTAALTAQCVGSIQKEAPDFAAPQGPDNQYEFIDMIDLQDGTPVDGNTGFVVASADDNRMFEVNVNGLQWVSVILTAGTAGELTVNARLFND